MNLKIILVIIGIVLSMVSLNSAWIQVVVCGTDGKTYSTPCALNEAAKSRPDLKLAHYGECKSNV